MPKAHDLLFRTLADPTRRALFERLCREGEQTVGALTARAGVSQPAVSKHLGVLKQAGLVRDRHVGRQTHYAAQLGALAPSRALEVGRRDPDNSQRSWSGRDHRTDHVSATSEAARPQAIADDPDSLGADLLVRVGKDAPADRNPKHIEIQRRHAERLDDRFPDLGQGDPWFERLVEAGRHDLPCYGPVEDGQRRSFQ